MTVLAFAKGYFGGGRNDIYYFLGMESFSLFVYPLIWKGRVWGGGICRVMGRWRRTNVSHIDDALLGSYGPSLHHEWRPYQSDTTSSHPAKNKARSVFPGPKPYTTNFVVGQVTPNNLATLKFRTYIFFGGFCLLSHVPMGPLLRPRPETRYKSLEEMDIVFKDDSGAKDRERMQAILSEVGLGQSMEGDSKSDLGPRMLGERMPAHVSRHEFGSL